jgi:hypothetical protein
LPADPKDATSAPKLVFKNGGVLDVQLLGGNKLLISSTSFLDNSLFFSVGPAAAVKSNATKGTTLILANLKNGTTYGLSQSQVGEVFYKGAGDYFVTLGLSSRLSSKRMRHIPLRSTSTAIHKAQQTKYGGK